MDIIYIDNHLLAADKPHNLLTQPSGTDHDSLEAQAKLFVKNEFHKPGNVFLEAVHRIDRQACGIVLFARTSKALSRLAEQIRNGSCQKIYRAIVTGRLPKDEGDLEDWLIHDDFKAAVVPQKTIGAKRATLHYRLLEARPDNCSLLEIQLETGRYHQIRAQLAHAGCPILGDEKYGSMEPYKNGAIALQHARLTVLHPITKESITFEAKHHL
ncbi:MAG: RluA family pseudouridine synthase [Lentisphaeria bacterium]|nr:RluA family pseudouridine synthase [Lentisphaeria bacterium]